MEDSTRTGLEEPVLLSDPKTIGRQQGRRIDAAGFENFDFLFQHRDHHEDVTLGLWTMKGLRAKETELLKPAHPGEGWQVRAVIDVNTLARQHKIPKHSPSILTACYAV